MSNWRVGLSPCLWNHPDHPTPGTPWEAVLAAIQAAGFGATEVGKGFPADAAVVRAAADAHGLKIAAMPFVPGLTDGHGIATALNEVNSQLDTLAALGGDTLVVSEPLDPARARVAGRVQEAGARTLRDDEWQNLADGLNELGARCVARGLKLAYWPRAGTFIETQTEIKKLMNMTDPGLVGLALDTGHALYSGCDPLALISTYWRRLHFVYLRDMASEVHKTALRHGLDLAEAQRRHVFPVLGQGDTPVQTVLAALDEQGYEGWVMVAADLPAGEAGEAAKASFGAWESLR